MTIHGSPRGIDISNHQGLVNWPEIAGAGMQFGFIKATEGNYYNDWTFPRNWQAMVDVGLARGAYHFARPSTSNPEVEAAFFLASVEHAGGLRAGDMLVLDFEDERYRSGGDYGSAGAWALGFCEYVEDAVGFPPVIYTGPWYIDSRDLADFPDLGRYPLWLAAYQDTMPSAPSPWPVISFWQYSSHGDVPGVYGPCDVNVFNGTADRISLLGKPGIDPVEPPLTRYTVGSGIWAAMDEYHDLPATNEHYVTPDWSEAFGTSGARYVYIASQNRVVRFAPDGG